MYNFKIYLKGGAVIETKALRVEWPDTKSKTLLIYVAEDKTDDDKVILTSEVAALTRAKWSKPSAPAAA